MTRWMSVSALLPRPQLQDSFPSGFTLMRNAISWTGAPSCPEPWSEERSLPVSQDAGCVKFVICATVSGASAPDGASVRFFATSISESLTPPQPPTGQSAMDAIPAGQTLGVTPEGCANAAEIS